MRLSEEQLCERAELGAAQLLAIEAGEREPELEELLALARGLGMRPGTLFRLWEDQRVT